MDGAVYTTTGRLLEHLQLGLQLLLTALYWKQDGDKALEVIPIRGGHADWITARSCVGTNSESDRTVPQGSGVTQATSIHARSDTLREPFATLKGTEATL